MADVLYQKEKHACVFFEELTEGEMVPSNQYLIIHNGQGLLLDPGGHVVYPKLMSVLAQHIAPGGLKYLFLSHQDPDVVASVNGWLMVTEAEAYVPSLWRRFVAHFGVTGSVMNRLKNIPDEGMKLDLGGCLLTFVPAHFLHSPANFQVYDPVSKILFSGDLGAAAGHSYRFVKDFDKHLEYMTAFHQRYMSSTLACQLWAKMIRGLDIETIAPQHGAVFQGKEMVRRFVDWVEKLQVGAETVQKTYQLPR